MMQLGGVISGSRSQRRFWITALHKVCERGWKLLTDGRSTRTKEEQEGETTRPGNVEFAVLILLGVGDAHGLSWIQARMHCGGGGAA